MLTSDPDCASNIPPIGSMNVQKKPIHRKHIRIVSMLPLSVTDDAIVPAVEAKERASPKAV